MSRHFPNVAFHELLSGRRKTKKKKKRKKKNSDQISVEIPTNVNAVENSILWESTEATLTIPAGFVPSEQWNKRACKHREASWSIERLLFRRLHSRKRIRRNESSKIKARRKQMFAAERASDKMARIVLLSSSGGRNNFCMRENWELLAQVGYEELIYVCEIILY